MARLGNARDIVSYCSMELGMSQAPIATVTGSLDQDISQMMALLSSVADEVMLEEPYRTLLGDDIWVTDVNGNPKDSATTDTDVILFDRRLAVDGLKYVFLQAKGLEFGEQLRSFINRMNRLAVRSAAIVVDLDIDEGREV
jgi:hypothetical protein